VALDPAGCATGWGYWPFIRRQITADGTIPQLALYHCAGAATTTGAQLVRVAETRWAIEECLPGPRHRLVTLAPPTPASSPSLPLPSLRTPTPSTPLQY
jgi:hypothetical protein